MPIHRLKIRLFWALTAALALLTSAHAELVFKDDSGRKVRLKAAARRIITLAPHATEILYAAGAGDRLVGVVDFSDYPPEARSIAHIGSFSRIDVEALEDLDPDSLAPRRARTDEELYDLALLIQRAAQEGLSTSGLDVVEATVLRRELLRAYVERLEPDDDVARERLYQRLKRQRSRAMQRLKSLLTTTSPIQLSIGF